MHDATSITHRAHATVHVNMGRSTDLSVSSDKETSDSLTSLPNAIQLIEQPFISHAHGKLRQLEELEQEIPPVIHLNKPRRRKSVSSRDRYNYAPFRSTCFSDPSLLPVCNESHFGSPFGTENESRKLWLSSGTHLSCETRFQNDKGPLYAPSLDRIYETSKQTMGYRAYRKPSHISSYRKYVSN